MAFIKKLFYSVTLTILFYNCSNIEKIEKTGELDSTKSYQELDIAYGDDSNQTFDLYLPANRNTDTKIIILVHGGGWISGDKSDMNILKDLIRTDFPNMAVANINYRLADENNPPYPMQIHDISSVISYLKENKSVYNISDNISFIGTSAGAHLSLLWSYAFDTAEKVNMVCSIVGPTNFTDSAYTESNDPALQALLLVYGPSPTTDFLVEVSPYHQVTNTAPPTILFYGGQDPLVPISQGTAMRDKLESLNVTHEFTLYPDAGHGWTGSDLLDTWAKLRTFISTHAQ
ncbi:alpha/beta hydrolase [Gaetbulibacter saemankumensis]|uniref:alpha/beta hydrolase n=1 Tax=Gaetbulibacter saemankumensis TaxID=311208 RepID=UPI0003F6FCE1|nr:alpha/beta hydrolase [Gaetbulibacter saemankumensis]